MEEQNQGISYAPPNRTDDSQTTRWKIDPEDVIDEIIHYLRGDYWDNLEQKWIINEDNSKRLVNEMGCTVIAAHLRGVLNKNVILSKIDHDMVLEMAKQNAMNVVKLIYTSYDRFKIDRRNFDVVLQIIDNNVYAALTKGEHGFMVNHLSTTQRHIEHHQLSLEERKKEKSSLPSLAGWKQ